MDYIESLAKQAQQLTMYDVKSYYNQAKNAVFNVSEMEAKVREATNDDPWGASSTLMQQIADGTHNFQNFNEIMPCIYARFMEKEAREWRQIYKALTLLEFLVKNGSERVVDDARAHVSTIKMLKSFHYVDEKGKDQGINVRNRAQEIANLLGDVDRIRAERKKARANKNKYQGQGNDGGLSFATASGGRYGGFGSESVGYGGSGGGGGGGGGGDRFDDYPGRATRRERETRESRQQEAEYDEYEGADDFDAPPRRGASASGARQSQSQGTSSRPAPPPKNEPPKNEKAKAKEVNLFDFDDEPVVSSAPTAATAGAAGANSSILGGDDDFDDFQTAPSTQYAPPVAAAPLASSRPGGAGGAGVHNANLFDLLNSSSTSSMPQQSQSGARPAASTADGVGMTSPPLASSTGMAFAQPSTSGPNYTATIPSAHSASAVPKPQSKPVGNAGVFDDLWNTSLSTVSSNPGSTTNGAAKKSMNEMDQQKTVDRLWGLSSGAGGAQGQGQGHGQGLSGGSKKGGDLDDLLL